MEKQYWLNDRLVSESDARVSVLDHGFTVADGVFETLKIVDSQPFATTLHLDRLERSCVGLGLSVPPREALVRAMNEVLSSNDRVHYGRMRITVTSGSGPLGSERSGGTQSLVIAVTDQKPWSASTSLALVPWVRNERSAVAGLKTTSYAENVIAIETAHKADCSEALFLDSRGNVSEGTGSNIFWTSQGRVFSPSATTGLLEGITRNLIVELCAQLGLSFAQGEYVLSDLLAADEVFVSSSTRDVHPVSMLALVDKVGAIERRHEFAHGEITQRLQTAFIESSRRFSDPIRGDFAQ